MAGQSRRAGVIIDDAAFLAGLQQAVKRMRLDTEGDLVRLGVRVQNSARQLCPVQTNRLRSSINTSGLQRDGRGSYVEVGTNVTYAPYVEFGTTRSSPQPFLRPALLEAAQAMRR